MHTQHHIACHHVRELELNRQTACCHLLHCRSGQIKRYREVSSHGHQLWGGQSEELLVSSGGTVRACYEAGQPQQNQLFACFIMLYLHHLSQGCA